jgi:hypothetical protein
MSYRASICPSFIWDKNSFADASLGRAWEKFVHGICDVRNPGSEASLKAWLRKVCYTAAMDENRSLTRKTGVSLDEVFRYGLGEEEAQTVPSAPASEPSPEEAAPAEPHEEEAAYTAPEGTTAETVPSEPEEAEEVLREGEARPFRTRYLKKAPRVMAEAAPHPEESIMRSEVVLKALKKYAGESERNAESVRMIILRFSRDWKCPRIAAYLFGEPLDKKQKQAREKRVWNHLNSDMEKLKILFKEEFGITSEN